MNGMYQVNNRGSGNGKKYCGLAVILLALMLVLTGCIDTKMYYKVYRNGSVRMTSTFSSENIYALAIVMESVSQNESYRMVNKGMDERGRYFVVYESLGQLSSDVFSVLGSNEKTENISVENKSRLSGGLLSRSYVFDTVFGSQNNEGPDSEYDWVYKSMPVRMIFDMPGVITSTTGEKIAENKVLFDFTMYELLVDRERIYVRSEENEIMKIFKADQRMRAKIEDNNEKISAISENIKKLENAVEYQEAVDEKIGVYIDKSLVLVAETVNAVIEYYYTVNNEYPRNMEEVKMFASDVVHSAVLDNDRFIYDPNVHKVKIVK